MNEESLGGGDLRQMVLSTLKYKAKITGNKKKN